MIVIDYLSGRTTMVVSKTAKVNQMTVLPLQQYQTTVTEKSKKNKEITCLRCKKVGHYSSRCEKENCLRHQEGNIDTNLLIAKYDTDKKSIQGQSYDSEDDKEED